MSGVTDQQVDGLFDAVRLSRELQDHIAEQDGPLVLDVVIPLSMKIAANVTLALDPDPERIRRAAGQLETAEPNASPSQHLTTRTGPPPILPPSSGTPGGPKSSPPVRRLQRPTHSRKGTAT